MKNIRQGASWGFQMLALIICILAGIMGLSDAVHKHDGDQFVIWSLLITFFGFAFASEIFDVVQAIRK